MKQIQPTELRIGNYYIGASRGWYEIATGRMIAQLEERKLNALPIPLTEEVLRAAGFEDWGKKEVNELETEWTFAQYNIIEGTSSLLVCLVESKYDGGVYKEWVLRIDHDTVYTKELAYLHQLQNLYFALTGSELEVSLPLIGNSPIRDNK